MEAVSRQPDAARMAKYLVCVDTREESRVALRLACMKAHAKGSQVGMLHVMAPVDFQTLGAVADKMREEQRKESEQLLQALAAEAMAAYGVMPSFILREGSAGDEIVSAALENPEVNMLVIGVALQSSGRGKLAAWLAGQLGNKLLIPLLMVPGNLTDAQLQTMI